MGTSAFKQLFPSDFTGIDAESSAIEADGAEVTRAVNYERAISNNLRGRTGRQLVGSPGGFFGIHKHSFGRIRTAYALTYANAAPKLTSTELAQTGETVTENLAINRQLFRLVNLSYTVTIVTAGTYTWYSYFGANGHTYFKIVSGAGTILDYDCGTGFEVPGTAGGLKTIYDLLTAIDATAALAVTFDRATMGPFGIEAAAAGGARPAGASTSYLGDPFTFVVNAGHTLAFGDYISFWDYRLNVLHGGFIVDDTVANQFDIQCILQPFVYAGQVLGSLGQPAASFPIAPAQSSSADFALVFPTWVWVPSPVRVTSERKLFSFSFHTSYYRNLNLHYKPPAFLSENGNCYIASTDYKILSHSGEVLKYDSKSLYGAGWDTPAVASRAAGTAAAHVLAAGTYRYKWYLRRIDSQGNYIESNASEVLEYTSTGGANSAALLTLSMVPYLTDTNKAWFHCYVKNAGGTNQVIAAFSGGPISISTTVAAGLRVALDIGEPITFIDSAGTLHRTYVISIDQTGPTYTLITVADQSGFTLHNHTFMSCGVTAMLLRTTAGGNQFYEIKELPCAYYDATTLDLTWEDCSAGFTGTANLGANTPDSTLIGNAQYLEIEIGKEHDPPPLSTLLCGHQGLSIYAGDPTKPNTVSYSLPGEPEYVPLASNNFDVPSSEHGQLTAVVSDDVNHLAVFKERSYFDVQGDLDSGAIDVQVKTEGDYGIASHATLRRSGSRLLGLSHLGIIQISSGFLDTQIARRLNARLIGQSWYPQWAIAVNDSGTRSYVLNIPTALDSFGNTTANTYVIDYSRPELAFLEQSFGAGFTPSAGTATDGDNLYSISFDKVAGLSDYPVGIASRRIKRFIGDSPTGDDGLSFHDGGGAISYIIETQINFGEPHLFKIPLRIRVDSIPNDYIAEGWVPFSMLVETGLFPDATYLGSGQPGGTAATITFSGSGTWYQDVKLDPVKCLVLMLRLTTAARGTAPFLTGYEILFKDAYAKEDLPKP